MFAITGGVGSAVATGLGVRKAGVDVRKVHEVHEVELLEKMTTPRRRCDVIEN